MNRQTPFVKVAVTGASGFIGRHVIQALSQMEGISVCAVRKNKITPSTYLSLENTISETIYDISSNQPDVYEILGKPDLLIHLAWSDLQDFQHPDHYEKELCNHYLFIKNMVIQGLPAVAVTGTCLEYGLQEGCLNENQPTLPVTSYGLAKDCLHKFLRCLAQKNPFRLLWQRLFYMYGEGQSKKALLPQLEQAIKKKIPEFNMSGGEQLRDYLPVEQVADCIVKTALSGSNGVLNICSGTPVSVRNIVEKRIRDLGATIKINSGVFPYPDYEPMAFWGDNRLLKKSLKNLPWGAIDV